MAKSGYPEDAFDNLPDDGPVGVHRLDKRGWVNALNYVWVVLLFGAFAYGGTWAYWNAEDISWLEWLRAPVVESTTDPSVTWDVSPTPSPTPSVTPSPTPTYVPTYIFDAGIVVYNDAGINGLAGRTSDFLLAGTDFTSISAGNWNGATPPNNVIRYSSEEFRDSASLLADHLGISTIALGPTDGVDIAVILVEEPAVFAEPSATPAPTPTP